jgi:hypothetical protein
MRRIFALAICSACVAPGAMAADVGVSIQLSQPGVFGRIDIGQYPQPQVIVAQPVIVEAPPPAMPPPEPVYLWVPVEHRKHWERHCREYHACGHPVYFVDHDWYRQNVLAHAYRPEGRHEDERYREHGREEDERYREHGREEDERYREHGREEEHGHHKWHDDEGRGRGHDDEGRGRGHD